ncbi:hypothetical protein HPP92_001587 [Vanilla planifolia]|uniref:Uncharacterized protein n=1 Tax=Vanilla planifolia TaxID=51239 RepID=A0A835RZK3_VANPL|nr:hypothetical protein HPP92_001587 [Vanilla planifolia]
MRESVGAPAMAPINVERGDQERWRHFDNSVNAVYFGFVATAILISMFLLMAIFERFLSPRSSLVTSLSQERGAGVGTRRPREALNIYAQHHAAAGKLECRSPKMSNYTKGVLVLMPGHDIPTFIAHPVLHPFPPEKMAWPSHKNILHPGCSSSGL